MEERAPGASGAIHHVFGEPLEIIRIVVLFVADDVDKPAPAAADANHFITFAEGAEGDRADRGVETGNVASSRENSNYTLLYVDISHGARLASKWSSKLMIMRLAKQN